MLGLHPSIRNPTTWRGPLSRDEEVGQRVAVLAGQVGVGPVEAVEASARPVRQAQ